MNPPTIDHIGIIVENLEQSVAMFERLFHLIPSRIKDIPDAGLRIAQLNGANISIELLQYSGQGKSLAKKTMGVSPGINHFSIKVEDIKASLKDLKRKGLKVMDGFPRPGSHGRVAFFEPETTQGILLEVCED
ncbi:MAG: VOC family protein [Desulfobacteraceae bacterium]|nr:MAG: VOC family protein [Desulfobacteraceae bacterium]